MNRLFIALPILALLSVGAILLIAHERQIHPDQLADTNDEVTIYIWQHCFQSLLPKVCDDLKEADELQNCYSAASATTQYVWDGGVNELVACKRFYTYFSTATSGDILNRSDDYHDCFLNKSVIESAKRSEYYFNSIYTPKYLTCAGFAV